MMATVPHVTPGLGLRKFQANGFLLTRVYIACRPAGLGEGRQEEMMSQLVKVSAAAQVLMTLLHYKLQRVLRMRVRQKKGNCIPRDFLQYLTWLTK